MTEKKATPKKTTPKKASVKKVEAKDVEAVEEVKPKAPTRKKRVEIDRNEMIACRSMTNGKLIYISDRTRSRYVWSDYGTLQYIEMGELLDMRASHPKFLDDVRLIVEDEDAVEYLGLTHKYETLDGIDNLDALFDKPADELLDILPKLPKGVQHSVSTRARKLVEEGTLEKLNTIRAIEEALNIDLKMFAD